MDIRKKAWKRVQGEYQRFKRKVMYRFSKEEVWDASSRIHFYQTVKEYFELNDRIPDKYLILILAEAHPLAAMWQTYLEKEQLGYQTWSEIDELLEDMISNFKLPIAG